MRMNRNRKPRHFFEPSSAEKGGENRLFTDDRGDFWALYREGNASARLLHLPGFNDACPGQTWLKIRNSQVVDGCIDGEPATIGDLPDEVRGWVAGAHWDLFGPPALHYHLS